MNLLTFWVPDRIYICDAAEYGLGGFANHGRAWTYQIPVELRNRAHINILEYLAQITAIWIDIIEGITSKEDCILAIGYNTSAMGWLGRSNFREENENDKSWDVKQILSRHLATLTLKSDFILYKQWLKGSHNQVADSLSRDAYFLNPNTHRLFLQRTVPQQLPQNFNIRPVPKEIFCFVILILQLLPEMQLQSSIPKPSELAHGNVGILSCIVSESKTSSWTGSAGICKISSYPVLHKQLERAPSLDSIMDTWRYTCGSDLLGKQQEGLQTRH